MRREQVCFKCHEAWTSDHGCKDKKGREADEIAKIEADQELARNLSQLIVERVEG